MVSIIRNLFGNQTVAAAPAAPTPAQPLSGNQLRNQRHAVNLANQIIAQRANAPYIPEERSTTYQAAKTTYQTMDFAMDATIAAKNLTSSYASSACNVAAGVKELVCNSLEFLGDSYEIVENEGWKMGVLGRASGVRDFKKGWNELWTDQIETTTARKTPGKPIKRSSDTVKRDISTNCSKFCSKVATGTTKMVFWSAATVGSVNALTGLGSSVTPIALCGDVVNATKAVASTAYHVAQSDAVSTVAGYAWSLAGSALNMTASVIGKGASLVGSCAVGDDACGATVQSAANTMKNYTSIALGLGGAYYLAKGYKEMSDAEGIVGKLAGGVKMACGVGFAVTSLYVGFATPQAAHYNAAASGIFVE